MSLRIWLTKSAVQALVPDTEKNNSNYFLLDGASFWVADEEGEKYINGFVDPFDPTARMPKVAHKHVKRVTVHTRYCEGFRLDGVYKYKGATARVLTERKVERDFGMNGDVFEENYQEMTISAGSMKTLREIYSQVRTGELKPDENWGVSQLMLDVESRRKTTETAH